MTRSTGASFARARRYTVEMKDLARILLLGCGYTGLEVARQAQQQGLRVLGTTRSAARAQELEQAGATPLVVDSLSYDALAAHVDESTALIITYPPDGRSDAACAALVRSAHSAAYVSSTGVYGHTRGVIDDKTPPAPDAARNKLRVEAEYAWRNAGAAVLRAAAIYGPGRGQHVRILSGSARIAGDGAHYVSRIHVVDLARALLRAVELRLGPNAYVVADDEPATQGDVVRYLAELLGVPTPASVPLDDAPETLRHDRKIDPSGIKRATQLEWLYPSYRSGFPAAIAAERGGSVETKPLA